MSKLKKKQESANVTRPQAGEVADFGFKTVEREKKSSLVHGVFASVAPKYDLMNDLMSFGLHRLWKNTMISQLPVSDGARLLDVAGGTGDIGFRYLKKARENNVNVEVVISDVNDEMLKQGKARSVDNNILSGISFKLADAENLPFDDQSFDLCTIAFGIRNVTNIDKALSEFYRVLKPGGRFVCLEFSHVENDVLKKIYDEYSFKVIPEIGKIVTGDRDSYQYLVESIRKFPTRDEFSKMIEAAGFSMVSDKAMTYGVVAIHSGWRI